jgi:hypothetical protein
MGRPGCTGADLNRFGTVLRQGDVEAASAASVSRNPTPKELTMSVRARAAGALLTTIVAGSLTVAVTGSGGTANAAGEQRSSATVGRAQPGSVLALGTVLGLTRSVDGRTYRAAGTYSAGSALTSLTGR